MSLPVAELARYSQQIKLSEIGIAGQQKLHEARVLCIGAGGLACPMLLYLAAAGVGTIGIIDDDIIEMSNLHRQVLYNGNHIGQKKAATAAHVLMTLNPGLTVHPYLARFNQENALELIECYDIVVDCSDNFSTRYIVNDSCYHLNKPFVFASIFQFAGQCATFAGNASPCFRCLFPMPPVISTLDCNTGGVLGVLPGLLGIIQATEVLKFLLNIGDLLIARLLTIDALSMQFREFQISLNPDCWCANKITRKLPLIETNNIITIGELQQKLKEDHRILLLDVRTMEERSISHIGGKHIPLSELGSRLDELNTFDEIIIYCQLGQRSLQAVALLKKAKFRYVKSLEGGLKAWQSQ